MVIIKKKIKKNKNKKTFILGIKQNYLNSSVIRQKGESSETFKFPEKQTFLTPWYAFFVVSQKVLWRSLRTTKSAYQEVRNVRFWKIWRVLFSRPFALLPTNYFIVIEISRALMYFFWVIITTTLFLKLLFLILS